MMEQTRLPASTAPTLRVLQDPALSAGPGVPRIIEHPKSLVVAKGDPATLNCAAQGTPHPRITWFRDGVEVMTANKDPHSHRVLFPSGSLFFLSIKQGKKDSDAGVYTCVATNANGRTTSRNATLTIAVLRDEFRVAPVDVSVASGERAEMVCSPPRGHPPPDITWTRNGHEIDPKEEPDRVQMLEDGRLLIKEVLQTDEGEYVCQASNPAGKRNSPPAILDVIVAPFWVKAPRDVVGVAGGEAELSCRVGGDPPPAVTWRRVGAHIPVGRMRMIKDRGLRVSHLRPQDAGVYVCNAANRAATISANASLTIYSSPRVSEVPGDVEVEEGAPLHLSCAVEGYPTPLVYWTREGSQKVLPVSRTPLEPSKEDKEEEEDGIKGVRIAYSVTRAAHYHSGRYVCGGVNSAGGVMTRVGVRVRPTPLLPPPIISVPPTNQTLPLRGHAGLTCRVWGSPEPKVTWRHRGQLVKSTKRREILPDNTLSISELVEDDGGEYVCVASSPRGVTEARATLVVANAKKTDVVFKRAPDPDTAPGPPDTPNVLAINASGATLQWDVPSRQGASPVTGYSVEYYSSMEGEWKRATSHIPRTTFTLTPVDPDVRYGVTVRAHNAHGVSEPSGIAEVGGNVGWEKAGKEEASVGEAKVVLQEAVLSGSSSAKLLWQMSGEGSFVEGFYIRLHHISRDQHHPPTTQANTGMQKTKFKEPTMQADTRLENFTVVTVVNAGRGASSYVLHGLHHYRSYSVFLVPFFKTFEGHPSNSRSFLTPEAAPSAAPQGVRVQLTNVTTASLFWAPPPSLQRNGLITEYQVDMVTSSGAVFLTKKVNGSVTSLRVHNLTLGNSYHLTLSASTAAGRGPFTPPISLHVDPVLLHPLAKSGTSLASLDGEVWVIGMIGGAVFCILLGCVATLLIWRRHARNKAMSHVSVQKVDNLGFGLVSGDSGLWQDYAGWQLEKLGVASDNAIGSTSGNRSSVENDVKVMNTAESVVECDNSAPRSLVTFYRGPTTTEGPYATTALLGPHSLPHQNAKAPKDNHRSSDNGGGEQLSLGHGQSQSERTYQTDWTKTLRRVKGGRPMVFAPPLPCLPPPGVPADNRAHSACYCSGSRASHHMSESSYSEAHYTPSVPGHPCYPGRPDHHQHPAHNSCPSTHVYASTTPLPPYPDSSNSRTSPGSPNSCQKRLSRNSAVYESASLQYAPAGYYIPNSVNSSYTSTASSHDNQGVSVSCGSSTSVERAVQSSLPSLTYQALKALGEDIEAFRHLHQLTDDDSSSSCRESQKSPTAVVAINHHPHHHHQHLQQQHQQQTSPPKFDAPSPPPSPPPPNHSSTHKSHKGVSHKGSSAAITTSCAQGHIHNGPVAGTLAPGGSLVTSSERGVGDGENQRLLDRQNGLGPEDEDEECSDCSCSCSEAESSVYAETEFAEEVRGNIQENGPVPRRETSGLRRHRHKRRPPSSYSTDSNYMQLPSSPPSIDALPSPPFLPAPLTPTSAHSTKSSHALTSTLASTTATTVHSSASRRNPVGDVGSAAE